MEKQRASTHSGSSIKSCGARQLSTPADSGLLPAKQESDSSTLSVDATLPCSADSESVNSNHRRASSTLAQGTIFTLQRCRKKQYSPFVFDLRCCLCHPWHQFQILRLPPLCREHIPETTFQIFHLISQNILVAQIKVLIQRGHKRYGKELHTSLLRRSIGLVMIATTTGSDAVLPAIGTVM